MIRPDVAVLLCIRSLPLDGVLGGAETQALRFANKLIGHGHQVTMLVGRHGRLHTGMESLLYHDQTIPVWWITVPRIRLLGSILFIIGAAYYLFFHSSPHKVVQISSIKFNSILLALLARLSRKIVIYRVTGELFIGGVPFLNPAWRFYHPLVARFYIWLLRSGHHFVVQNTSLLQELEVLGLDRHNIALIPNGVDTHHFAPPPPISKTALRTQLNLPSNGQIICLTSRLSPVKRVDLAIKAFHSLTDWKDASLLLVGDGEQKAELQSLAASLGLSDRIYFAGSVQDVSHFLQAVDVYILPSDYEAHSNALIEALACGLPVVVTNVGGNRDTIQDGVNGLLVPPGDVGAMTAAIERILENENLAAQLGASARQSVLEKYSFDVMVQNYLDLYTSLTEPEVQRSE